MANVELHGAKAAVEAGQTLLQQLVALLQASVHVIKASVRTDIESIKTDLEHIDASAQLLKASAHLATEGLQDKEQVVFRFLFGPEKCLLDAGECPDALATVILVAEALRTVRRRSGRKGQLRGCLIRQAHGTAARSRRKTGSRLVATVAHRCRHRVYALPMKVPASRLHRRIEPQGPASAVTDSVSHTKPIAADAVRPQRHARLKRFVARRSDRAAAALPSVLPRFRSHKGLPAASLLDPNAELLQRLARAGIEVEPIPKRELLTTAQAAERIGMTREDMRKSIDERRLFAFQKGRVQLVPAFFADPSIDRGALERTSVALGNLPPDAKWQFFTQPRGEFGGASTLDALRAGQVELVLTHARAFRDAP